MRLGVQGCPTAALPKVRVTFHTKGLTFPGSYRMFSSEPKFPEQFICVGRILGTPTQYPFTAVIHCYRSLLSSPFTSCAPFLFVFKSLSERFPAKWGHEERRERWRQALQSWVTDFTLSHIHSTLSAQHCKSPRTWLLAGHCEQPLLSRQEISSPNSSHCSLPRQPGNLSTKPKR